MTHRILLRGVVIDVPSEQLPATRRFWSGALLTESRVVPGHSEFIGFSEPAALANVGLQDVGDSPAALHLDTRPTTWRPRLLDSSCWGRERSFGIDPGSS